MKMDKNGNVTGTKKDSEGRIWTYCDGDGSWSYKGWTIGCGAKNAKKWAFWYAPEDSSLASYGAEFKTLKEAMYQVYEG